MTPEEQHDEIAFAAGTYVPRTIFVHPTAKVGERTITFPFAYIGPQVTIDEDCVIGPGACIGQPGFGYEELPDLTWAYREHIAGVTICDDVHIGANACIDQGRWRATEIKRGARIDNGVHIAHNAVIGANALVIANAMVAGSCVIGDGAIIGPSASIRDHVTVGWRAMIGMGAVVVKDVPPGEVWAGNPARFMRLRGDELR